MTASTVISVLFVSVLFAVFSPVVSSDPDVQRAHPGQDVTLRCQVDGDVSIRAVEWTRRDLEPDSVLYYSDGHLDPTNQHPSFKGRVELVDRELKEGNVSLILRNISINDNGTYECRVAVGGSQRSKRANIKRAPIGTITLEVTDSDTNHNAGSQINTNPTDGNNNNHVGLAASLVLVCFAVVGSLVVFVLVRKFKRPADNQSDQPAAADEAVGDQLI